MRYPLSVKGQFVRRLGLPFRAMPFTLAMVALVIASSLVAGPPYNSGALSYTARFGYSLTQISAGRPWVVITMLAPWADWTAHIPAIISFLVLLGSCERLLGARRTWFIYLAGHLLTMLLVTFVLLAGLTWCGRGACGLPVRQLDTGTSVGVLCCVAATLRHVHPRRGLEAVIMLVMIAWLVVFRTLYAVEHVIAFPVGYVLARAVTHFDQAISGRVSRRAYTLYGSALPVGPARGMVKELLSVIRTRRTRNNANSRADRVVR